MLGSGNCRGKCLKYGLGTPEKLGRVLLVGYTQYDAETGEKLSAATRQRMRKLAAVARLPTARPAQSIEI